MRVPGLLSKTTDTACQVSNGQIKCTITHQCTNVYHSITISLVFLGVDSLMQLLEQNGSEKVFGF